MVKVLGMVGSPRQGGNTQLLMEAFLSGVEENGAQGEMISLQRLTLNPCDGCFACWQPDGRCVKQDDMSELYTKIEQAEIIAFGTPVYWYGPTALMKGVIDRLVFYNYPLHRQRIRNKTAVILVPCEETDPAVTQLIEEFFLRCFRYLEMDFAGKIMAPGLDQRGAVRQHPDFLQQARNLGQQVVRRVQDRGERQ
ncbi:MAG TPA: flavodoxin family protein [Patescibacteria group bacterium]|nr:flavodoxin family protein [Patescibacteria group bacterium]